MPDVWSRSTRSIKAPGAVARYRISGQQLELRDAKGAVALELESRYLK